jgi:hypothetical protein
MPGRTLVGPDPTMTAARAAPWPMVKVATATAMANSKSFEGTDVVPTLNRFKKGTTCGKR